MRAHAAVAGALLALGIWLSSGTLAPYAASVARPTVVEPCHYLVSVDHPHHIAPFFLLMGAPPEYWQWSVVLRRILYPIAVYPFIRLAGVLVGGLIANILLSVGAQIGFAHLIARKFGRASAIATLWLLATYPGITYWAGLPYSYAAIVPASLFCMALLLRLDDATQLRDVIAAATMMGIAFLAYDLLPFFLPAAMLILIVRRRYTWTVAAALLAVLPTLVVLATFRAMSLDVSNSNTSTYGAIVNSYLHPLWNAEWAGILERLPLVLLSNFLFSNFVFLPLLFVIVLAIRRGKGLGAPELAILTAALALFLFNNAAPPYYGWQMRGEWIARLYQPIFVVFLLAVGRALQAMPQSKALKAFIVAAVIGNAAIVFGPITLTRFGPWAYLRFYQHAPTTYMLDNLRLYGRRPLGICRTTHEGDNLPNPDTEFNRPAYAYRYEKKGP
jgi:hypothetical protein